MRSLDTFLDAGWDFAGSHRNGSEDIWHYVPGELPKLSYQQEDEFTVTFSAGLHGQIVSDDSVQQVKNGLSASSPLIEPDSGWWWTGWDSDFSVISGELTVTAQYRPASEKGEGTESSPLLIASIGDLSEIKDFPQGFFRLIKDINCKGFNYSASMPESFSGELDGDGFKLFNLESNGESCEGGLFSEIAADGAVRNLIIDNARISKTQPNLGSLADVNEGVIQCCTIYNSLIVGWDYTGGFAGLNSGIIYDCKLQYSRVESTEGAWYTGGLAGGNSGTIEESKCTSSCSITGSDGSWMLGGAVGVNSGGYITMTCSKAEAVGGYASTYTAGFAGGNESGGIIEKSWCEADVYGKDFSGQIAGFCGANDRNSAISNCYYQGGLGAGNEYFNDKFAGFCFRNSGLIEYSYTDSWTNFPEHWENDIEIQFADFSYPDAVSEIYGSAVYSDGRHIACLYDYDYQSPSNFDPPEGVESSSFTASDLKEEGWDLINESDNGTEDIWIPIPDSPPAIAGFRALWGGDISRNGAVGYGDLNLLLDSWLTEGTEYYDDINADGIVDMLDFAIYTKDFKEEH
ncbi:hypothetical protein [Sedimentisphaera salicampi]|uniref:hypothetical protein n=1 Tax=Sedimentisphaera salicampi TaxID=1941349 RepID=UPI000B9ADDA1|nr:hypothetical protein [Sedimentisphaera salicampi]OXU14356.1 hypothetical protein SMSP1_01897 [Sedimentisphaera salicampi]